MTMKQLQIDSALIMDKFYVDLFNSNQERGYWRYTAIDGTEVNVSGDGHPNPYPPYWYYAIQLVPVNDYYALGQFYDKYGDIISRGKYSWERIRGIGGITKVGDWEYYDADGEKTVVNEDATYGEFTYEDVIRKLESRGILNRRTGKNREGLDIYFHPSEGYWHVSIIDEAGLTTGEGKYHEIHIHKDTGRILKNATTKYMVIDIHHPPY